MAQALTKAGLDAENEVDFEFAKKLQDEEDKKLHLYKLKKKRERQRQRLMEEIGDYPDLDPLGPLIRRLQQHALEQQRIERRAPVDIINRLTKWKYKSPKKNNNDNDNNDDICGGCDNINIDINYIRLNININNSDEMKVYFGSLITGYIGNKYRNNIYKSLIYIIWAFYNNNNENNNNNSTDNNDDDDDGFHSDIDSDLLMSSEEELNENNSCRICFEPYLDGQYIVCLPCLHKFHKGCIQKWLQRSKLCPICKEDVVKYFKSQQNLNNNNNSNCIVM